MASGAMTTAARPRAPLSTYRIQINQQFDLNAAATRVDYLARLGIDCLYTSPFLQATRESTHGYDTVDYSKVDEEWGGENGRQRLSQELRRVGMGQVLDVVPNHMAIAGRQNPWWWDVLENGLASKFARYFDVDWDPPERDVQNIVLLPILGDHYGTVLERGELRLIRERGEILVQYHERSLPVAPRSLPIILAASTDDYLGFLADALAALPAPVSVDADIILRRHRDRAILLMMLGEKLSAGGAAAAAIDAELMRINHDCERLHEFLERQNYRLAYWRTSSHDLGYRRFFDINSLVGLRMENPEVFAATHQLIIDWVAEGDVRGLRIDHPDGLRDPAQYFERLCAACPQAWIVAEKILGADEELPREWPIDGSSGYDFMNLVGGLLVDPSGEEPLTDFYKRFTGEERDFAVISRECKVQILRETLGGDVNRLTALLHEICKADWRYRDFSRHDAQEALRSVLVMMDVYRAYVRPASIDEASRRWICAAFAKAKDWRTDLDPRLLDFLQSILLMEVDGALPRELAMRFQQTGAATMAKGVEDTAFYRYNRFIALNEVGGAPDCFGRSVEDFLRWCETISARWPTTMLATSTHDTKRSEDVRARLSVLSEIPEQWIAAVTRWSAHNEVYRKGELPERNTEYQLYQTLVGAWPIDEGRVQAYALKAAREAKRYTSWSAPNLDYEDALAGFVSAILADERFFQDLDEFVAQIKDAGQINSLTQTLLKLIAPGVPDFYQGCELWSLTLVDPDNRGPIDYERSRRLLHEIECCTVEQVMARTDEGLPKLWLIKQGLTLRNQHPEWFGAEARCAALPLLADAAAIGLQRGDNVIAIAPRSTMRTRERWAQIEVELPAGHWRNILTGECWEGAPLKLKQLLARFPVALLAHAEAR